MLFNFIQEPKTELNGAMHSKIVEHILNKAKLIARTQKNVLIIGEYGSGKSWLAKKIHSLSNRKENPFFRINCYTMQEDEIRKKIFGHLAFTDRGAKINRGLFEQCTGGTILLEGWDSIPVSLQLQIIESVRENKTSHFGSQRLVPIDVRIIGSIDVHGFHNVQKKYKLLNTVLSDDHYAIFFPPLRYRREDIADLIHTFLNDEFSHQYDFASRHISPRALYLCIRHSWPGNVRQLKNAIEHTAITSAGNSIQPEHLPKSIRTGQPDKKKLEYLEYTYSYKTAEKYLLGTVLSKTNSEKEIQRLLDLEPAVLQQKIQQYNLVNSLNKSSTQE